ncbi:MAG: monooxygenase [Proteobacteria bacterium]|nr:monooxygenase [Pseudomonadota bacterium]
MGSSLPENSLAAIPLAADYRAAIEALVADFAATGAERDQVGGTAKRERDLIRQSGLLRLSVPQQLGGLGANWVETLSAVRRLAMVDSSLAHLFAFHHLMLATLQFFGSPEQAEALLRSTVRDNWFWGNAMNPLDPRTRLSRTATGYRLDGDKSFCSGASDSDRLIVSAIDSETETLRILAIPTSRRGIVIHDDWDNMGQRQTDSGTVTFTDVFVAEDEILRDPGPMGSPYASLRPSLAQLVLTNIYLGLADGALEQARSYLHGLPQPALERIGEAPYVLRNFGDLWVEVAGARALADQALHAFQYGWEAGRDGVTAELRGEIAVAIAAAKVASSRASLNVGSRIFDVMGARATTARNRFDRYWRNARTHTLHDPLDYKLRELGNWAFKGQFPSPSFYS